MHKLNRADVDLREQILFGEKYDAAHYKMGGIRYFGDLSLKDLNRLIDCNLICLTDAQNAAPSVQQIRDWLAERNDDSWYVHGYAISPERDDYRVTIEGCGKHGEATLEEGKEFYRMFRLADELSDGSELYCWYD